VNRQQRRAALSAAASRRSWEWERVQIHSDMLVDFPAMRNIVEAWRNDLYSVQVYDNATEWGHVTQLTVRSHYGKVIPWDDLQRVKNELVAEKATAIEVYPAVDDLVDKAPMRHLWVLPPGHCLPFGLHRAECWGNTNAAWALRQAAYPGSTE